MNQNYSLKNLKKISPLLEEVKDILTALYQDKLIDALLAKYDQLDADFRTDIPLKRIWTIADTENEVD